MSNIKVIFPGSFDPITHGHTDIIKRASARFDAVVVAITVNTSKNSLFTVEERLELAKEVLKKYDNVTVTQFEGLLVDFAKEQKASFILRSLRGAMDVSWELQLAMMNRKMAPDIETVFMSPSEEYQSVSATLVREIALNGGNVLPFVDHAVAEKLKKIV